MQYVCDAPDGYTWFRLETENEADQESELMKHAVEKHFRRARETATASYQPTSTVSFEANIGPATHIQTYACSDHSHVNVLKQRLYFSYLHRNEFAYASSDKLVYIRQFSERGAEMTLSAVLQGHEAEVTQVSPLHWGT